MGKLSKDDIEDLIEKCGSEPTIWKRDEMQICCPVHQERNPSMGVSYEKQICHCFACGFAGNFPWLLFNASDDFKSYREAVEFIENEYGVTYDLDSDKVQNIKRYDDVLDSKESMKRKELPLYKLAPFMSGKETYQYFFKRGFSKSTMQKYMIGRDLDNKTVTIPVFYEDNTLAGVIGRFISKKRKKNERYKIYDHFERGKLLYPLNHFENNGTVILVEGQFDAIRLQELGYKNALAKMGVSLTDEQSKYLIDLGVERIINIGDNDKRGEEGRIDDYYQLKRYMDILSVDYPSYGKDVCDWSDEDIKEMIENAHGKVRNIRRYV